MKTQGKSGFFGEGIVVYGLDQGTVLLETKQTIFFTVVVALAS
jgi:hypothetical protein